MKHKLKRKWLYVVLGVGLLLFFFYYQNNALVTTEYHVRSSKIPQTFDDYKIVQLSDLHGKQFGNNQSGLVESVRDAKPDMIVFTGDLIDSRRYNEEHSLKMMERLVDMAPVYYVSGNHEWRSGKFNSLEEKLQKLGVQVMRNSEKIIPIDEESIRLIGIDDPTAVATPKLEETVIADQIENAMGDSKGQGMFRVLLSHRPEFFPLYAELEMDLVFTGHAHGGQFRLPFIGGLVAPGQGIFPDYTAGKHMQDQTAMIVNRGLGNSIFPLRIFNRPEIVVVTLKSS